MPPPGHYDGYPYLNAATHATGDPRYYPDRLMQRVARHSIEPFFLSLPQTEQNRLWQKQLFPEEKKKKRMDEMSAEEAEKVARSGKHPDDQHRNPLDAAHRVMPFCAHTRMPVGHGVWPHIKHVHSEPGFQIYKPQQGTTRTFEAHVKLHHKRAVKHGVSVLKQSLNFGALKDKGLHHGDGHVSLMGALRLAADPNVQKQTGLAKLKPRKKLPNGLGERMAELSFKEFRATNGMPVSSM